MTFGQRGPEVPSGFRSRVQVHSCLAKTPEFGSQKGAGGPSGLARATCAKKKKRGSRTFLSEKPDSAAAGDARVAWRQRVLRLADCSQLLVHCSSANEARGLASSNSWPVLTGF